MNFTSKEMLTASGFTSLTPIPSARNWNRVDSPRPL
jgi:hypothetical protein